MFSGIVEETATVVALVKEQENLHLTMKCSFVDELKIDQSVAHNGVCLTVVKIENGTYTVTAMKETIELLRQSGHECAVMVGGAVLTEEYAREIGADYYARDAKASADIAKEFFAK